MIGKLEDVGVILQEDTHVLEMVRYKLCSQLFPGVYLGGKFLDFFGRTNLLGNLLGFFVFEATKS